MIVDMILRIRNNSDWVIPIPYKRFLAFFLFVSKLFLIFAPTKVKDIDGILRPTMLFVGQVEGKGVNGRYHSVLSNFAT